MKNSKWIWIDKEYKNNEYAEFLTTFIYKNEDLTLELSVDTEYALFLNGEYVTSGQYADFPWYKVYDVLDLTGFAKQGENELKILVWHMGDNSYCHYVNRAGLRYELSAGGRVIDCSSAKTLCRPYPFLISGDVVKKFNRQLGYSFVWEESEPLTFGYATEISGMPEEFYRRPIKNLEALPHLAAEKKGKIYDLGTETVGYPYIELCAAPGERLNIAFSEWVKDDGTLPRVMFDGKYDFSFEIIGTGKPQKVFNPLRKLGCRYFEISGSCEVNRIGLLPIRYPFVHREYQFDSELRKEIYNVSVKTLELCAFEHYWDCPWREQAFWTFDSRFQMRYGYVAFEGTEYQRAGLDLLSRDRRDDGLITMVVPATGATTIPSFSLSYIMAMAEYIEKTGDISLAEEHYDKIKSVMHAYLDRIEDGLVPNFEDLWNFYEWKSGYSRVNDRFDVLLNLMTAFALEKFIRVCDALGKNEEKKHYTEIKCGLISVIRARFFNEDTGLYKSFDEGESYSELANSLAVLVGAVNSSEAAKICDIITEKTVEMTETTLSMTAFKYDALIAVNKEKYSDFILNDIDLSFGKMLDAGATSFWETLLGKDDFEGSGSLCHGWSALPIYYYKELGVLK